MPLPPGSHASPALAFRYSDPRWMVLRPHLKDLLWQGGVAASAAPSAEHGDAASLAKTLAVGDAMYGAHRNSNGLHGQIGSEATKPEWNKGIREGEHQEQAGQHWQMQAAQVEILRQQVN